MRASQNLKVSWKNVPTRTIFTRRTPGGIRAGKDFLARLNERSQNRDKEITATALRHS